MDNICSDYSLNMYSVQEMISGLFYPFFWYQVLEMQCECYTTHNTWQFGRATFQKLSGHV